MGASRSKVNNVPALTPEDADFLKQIMGQNTGQDVGQAFSSYYSRSPDMMYEDFLKRVREPALQNFRQSIVPEIQQQFGGLNASSSSALNQALGQSAQDLSTSLNTSFLDYYGKERDRGLDALKGLLDIVRIPKFTPTMQPRRSPWGQITKGIGNLVNSPLLDWIMNRYVK